MDKGQGISYAFAVFGKDSPDAPPLNPAASKVQRWAACQHDATGISKRPEFTNAIPPLSQCRINDFSRLFQNLLEMFCAAKRFGVNFVDVFRA